jgi:plastocyanin domain-containing protein
MNRTRWLTLGAAAALFGAVPAGAADTRPPAAARTVEVTVTGDGFSPAHIAAKQGERLRLVVTRRTEKTCAKEIVVQDQGIHEPLPLGKPVAVEVAADRKGDVRFACGMDMIAGTIHVQ